MVNRLISMLFVGACAFAQEEADIPPPFRNLITPEAYFQLRDAHLNILRGLPADPSLRDNAVQRLKQQQRIIENSVGTNLVSVPVWAPL